MDTAVTFMIFGLFSVVLSTDPSSPDQFVQGAGNVLDDIIQRLTCLDGSCGLKGPNQFVQVTSSPVPPVHVEPAVPVIVEPIKPVPMSPYLEECIHFVSQQQHIRQDPKIKAFEDKHWEYYHSVLSAYNQYPDKRNEIMVEALSETIQFLFDLKHQYETEIVAHPIPVQPVEEPVEEIIAEDVEIYPPFIGSVRGIPGVHYPNYTEVPLTSFSCGEQEYIPGFYADLETGCQVFHVCYEHRRESFLCPVGTIFNQPILACDYWYSSNCSLSKHYYDVNARKPEEELVPEPEKEEVQQIITTIIEQEKPIMPSFQVKSKETETLKSELHQIVKFLPVKAKILEFPRKVAEPRPLPQVDPKFVTAAAQAKLAIAAAVPVFKAGIAKGLDLAAKKVAVEALGVAAGGVIGKKKVAAKVVAAALAKKKIASLAKGVGVAAASKKKIAIPLVKAKALPVLKAAKAIPFVKAAAVKSKVALAKGAALPLFKTKLAVISPLTKKALALGYLKLLKAKKLALMG